jgi:CheY-like chemotaxis protein
MEAVGTLAGGIAHDFNNLLQGVSGYVQLLLALKDENHEDRKYLVKANDALNRSAKLVQRLLTLSRKSQSNFKPVDLNELVNRTIDLLQHAIPKMIAIKSNLTPELQLVRADANQIEQVLVNLVNNAVDAMEGAGRLTMETGMFHMIPQPHTAMLKLEPGDYVLVQVSDTGMGIDEKTRKQIFDAFFTTKEVGKGTGLGLATSYNIVENHGGHIACYSEVGEGTTFKIYLPVDTETKACELTDAKDKKDRVRGTETILLVDDEEDIRETSKKFLATCGYNVYTSASAEEAFERYRANEEEIDLIIMDLGMPGMGGEKGLAEFLKYDRNLKIIIASGYSAHRIAKAPQEYGAARFVPKPYDFEELNKTIREILG